MIRRFISCLLSFLLIAHSIPIAGFASAGTIKGPSRFSPGGPEGAVSSGLEFYRRLVLFPEFSRNSLSAAYLTIQAAPLLRQYGPMAIERDGDQILLTPMGAIRPAISIPIRDSFKASPSLVRLAQELDEAQNGARSSSNFIDLVLKRFYEDEGVLEQFPEESPVLAASGRRDIWIFLEGRISAGLGLKPQIGLIEAWQQKTAEILRNKPEASLRDALMEAFSRTHLLNAQQIQEARDWSKTVLKRVDEGQFMARHGWKQKHYTLESGIVSQGRYNFGSLSGPMEEFAAIDGHKAAKLSKDMGHLIWFMRLDGQMYVRTTRGIWQVQEFMEDMPRDWQGEVLRDVGQKIEAMQQTSEKDGPAVPKPLKTDEKGNILGEDGRIIFSGFKHGANVLLAMLGAGALEGLSRLALSLGSLNLGFGEQVGRAESSGKDVWPVLERWMEESLDLKVRPGRSQEWKKETAEVLRGRPSLSLEQALAEGLTRVQSLNSEKSRETESMLGGKAAALPNDPRWTLVERIFELDGKLHITTNNGIYRKEGEKWKPVLKKLAYKLWMDEFENDKMKPIPRFVSQIIRIGGKLYGATDQGLFVQEGKGWRLILGNETHGMVGTVYQVAEIGGILYAAAEKGLYAFKKGRWNSRLLDAGGVYQVVRFQGILYAATASGLFAFKDKKWKKEKINNSGWFHSLAEIDGNLYATAQRGLYLKQGNGWKLLLEEAGAVRQVLKLDGILYAAAEKGLYVLEKEKWRQALKGMGKIGRLAYWDHAIYLAAGGLEGSLGLWRWAPAPKKLPADWRRKALRDLGLEIERAQKAREKKGADTSGSFSSDEEGNILGEDGRTLFSGPQ